MTRTVPLTVLRRGFLRLTLFTLPVTLPLLLFIGTMAGGSPASAGPGASFGVVAALLFLGPGALVLTHVAGAKLFDGLLRRVPLGRPEVTWLGILVSGVAVVAAGTIFVDDLHQVRQGNYSMPLVALALDLAGMAAVVAAGSGRRADRRDRDPPLRPAGR